MSTILRGGARGTVLPGCLRSSLAGVLLLAVSGCGLTIPTDPEGTLDRVRTDGVLRAGAAPNPGWVEVSRSGADPTGREASLVQDFAQSLGADVEWTVATEEHLVTLLEEGDLDLAVGGFTDQNPWVSKAALTRPYVEEKARGTTEKHVMMVRFGENALLSELETWLDEHGGAR